MKQATKKLLNDIANYPWFSRLGVSNHDYSVCTSVSVAVKFINSIKWDHFDTAIMNRYFDIVDAEIDRSSKQYQQLSEEIRTDAYAIAEEVIASHDQMYKPFFRDIKGVICGAAFEVEFHPPCPLFWYIPKILPVYRLGHIVCGWDGPKVNNEWRGDSYMDLPDGKLRVY